MPHVFIPPALRKFTAGQQIVDVTGGTIRDVVESLEKSYPGLRERLCRDDRLRPEISVAVDSRVSSAGLREKVTDESQVQFLTLVSGG